MREQNSTGNSCNIKLYFSRFLDNILSSYMRIRVFPRKPYLLISQGCIVFDLVKECMFVWLRVTEVVVSIASSKPMVVGSTPISCTHALVTQWSECGSYECNYLHLWLVFITWHQQNMTVHSAFFCITETLPDRKEYTAIFIPFVKLSFADMKMEPAPIM